MAVVYTAGHGNRTLVEFLALLQSAGIELVVDVRALPSSRRHPHFNRAALQTALGESGMGYLWEGKSLGGFRKPVADSPHVALRRDAFRGFADHSASVEFALAIERVLDRAGGRKTVLICAERDPLHCHRALIADWLLASGHGVVHLIDASTARAAKLNPLVRLEGGRLIYERSGQPVLL